MVDRGIPGATLTSLSPSSVPAGSPPFTLTVNGSGFVAGGSLSWNGTTPLGQYTFVSSTQVTVQIGAGLIMSPGSGVDRSHDSNSPDQPLECPDAHHQPLRFVGMRPLWHVRFFLHRL